MKTFDEIHVESDTNATLTVGYENKVGELHVTSAHVDQGESVTTWRSFSYDGDTGVLAIGDLQMGLPGKIVMGAAGVHSQSVLLDSATSTLALGGDEAGNGTVRLKNRFGTDAAVMSGETATLTLGAGTTNGDDRAGSTGAITAAGEGVSGGIIVKNSHGIETVRITGSDGHIEFLNADVAEEFEVQAEYAAAAVPGTVMVLEESGRLRPCTEAYDSRVVGIIAGAGRFQPGIVLDRSGGRDRRAIALLGKTGCYADASAGPIGVGDLLTTSPTSGHAMRVTDRARAFGAVIGKALQPLAEGTGLIPVLVKPQ